MKWVQFACTAWLCGTWGRGKRDDSHIPTRHSSIEVAKIDHYARCLLLLATLLWGAKAEAQLLTAPPTAGGPVASASAYCPPPAAVCGSDGLCTDLENDPDNCGACGNSCGGVACVKGSCAKPSERGGFALGINLGGVWGEGEVTQEGMEAVSPDYSPFGTNFLFSGQAGYRGRRASLGLRLGLSSASPNNQEVSELFKTGAPDARFDQLFVRFGGFVDINVYQLKVDWVDLVTYIEGALYVDVTSVTGPNDTFNFFGAGVTPALGAGVDFGVIKGLRAGVYGGLDFFLASGGSFESEGFSAGLGDGPTFSGSFVGGEFRLNLTYTFGSTRAAPKAGPKSVYALLLEEFEQQGAEGREAYAFGTPRYEQSFGKYRKAAVAAPSSCENRSASGERRAGDAGGRASNEVLATTCGVEMAMLERVLAERGYIVTSWRSIAQTAQTRSSVEVARSFGAEVLFQVNSLGPTAREAGGAQVRYTWLKSDAFGNHGPELQSSLTLSASDIEQLNGAAVQRQQAAVRGEYPGAMADIVAIDVATGETVWLYRWERVLASGFSNNSALLMKGTPYSTVPGAPRAWSIENPLRPQQIVPKAAPSLVTERNLPGGANGGRSAQDQLLEEIVRDFVGKFQTGQGRQEHPPGAAQQP